jgi:hypothetical protein
VWAVAEQHPVGGGEGQRVAGAFLPTQVLRSAHQLLGLDARELGEAAIRRLVAPDPLAGREHRVAAIALLIVAVVLVAVDHHFVADFPALHLVADRPDDARRVGAGDVERGLVNVEGRDRRTERRPDAVVVDSGGHDEDEHLVAVDGRRLDHLELHGGVRFSVPFAPDRPGVHLRGNMAERRDLPHLVKVLDRRVIGDGGGRGVERGHAILLQITRLGRAKSCAFLAEWQRRRGCARIIVQRGMKNRRNYVLWWVFLTKYSCASNFRARSDASVRITRPQ